MILGVILAWREKNALDASFNQALERTFELRMAFGVFELEQVKIPPLFVEVKTIQPVVVATKGHLIDRLFPHVQDSARIKVLRDSAASCFEIGVCLSDGAIVYHKSISVRYFNNPSRSKISINFSSALNAAVALVRNCFIAASTVSTTWSFFCST